VLFYFIIWDVHLELFDCFRFLPSIASFLFMFIFKLVKIFDFLILFNGFSFLFIFQFHLVIIFLVHIMTLAFLIVFIVPYLKKPNDLVIFDISVFESDLNHSLSREQFELKYRSILLISFLTHRALHFWVFQIKAFVFLIQECCELILNST